jgi:hypothetical protein
MRGVIDRLKRLFNGFVLAPRPSGIAAKSLKRRDLTGHTAMLDPLLHQPVDLDMVVAAAVKNVAFVTMHDHGHKLKGPVVIVRGDGGGKTRAMIAIAEALLRRGDMYPILITFSSHWPAFDIGYYSRAYPSSPGIAIALAVISRMAAVSFGVDLEVVTTMLRNADLSFLTEQDQWRYAIAAFTMVLAERAGATNVVLLVDDVTCAVEALDKAFSSEARYGDAAEYIRHALLNQDFTSYGFSSALVLSGTDISIAGFHEDAVIFAVELTEVLNATDVINRLFLMDADEDGTLHTVIPSLAGSTERAHQALAVLAAVFCHHPRGIECVQDELRVRVDRSDPAARELPLTPASLQDVYHGALQQFQDRFPNQKFPEPDLLCDVLFHVWATPLDDRVRQGIRRSVFVNALTARESKGFRDDHRTINLRSSLVSLFAAVQNMKKAKRQEVKAGSVEGCIENLVLGVSEWVAQEPSLDAVDATLRTMAFAWLRLLLTAAARAKRSIKLRKTLVLYSLDLSTHGAVDRLVREYLFDVITLPETGLVPLCTLQHTCFDAHDTAAVRNGALNAVSELDNICLSEECPVVLLQAAPGDSWDFGLAYLGSAKRGQRAVRVVLFRCEVPQGPVRNKTTVTSCAATDYATDTAAEGRTQLLHQRVMTAVEGWHKGKQLRSVGRCIRDQQHLFVHITTQPGDSTADGNVVHMRGRDTGPFFNFMFPVYEALQAATRSTVAMLSDAL